MAQELDVYVIKKSTNEINKYEVRSNTLSQFVAAFKAKYENGDVIKIHDMTDPNLSSIDDANNFVLDQLITSGMTVNVETFLEVSGSYLLNIELELQDQELHYTQTAINNTEAFLKSKGVL